MRIIIIEDEQAASKRLHKMIYKIDPTLEVEAILDSVEDSIEWFNSHDDPDLIIVDIHLSDGLCFEIFEKVTTQSPVIFTTAYDEYAVEAFKLNSIDYLLKPVEPVKLEKSLTKFRKLKDTYGENRTEKLEKLLRHFQSKEEYKSRFLVKSGQSFRAISISNISYFFIESQIVFLITDEKRKFIVEHSLDELEKLLNPENFFRINRQMILSLKCITSINQYFNSRLKLTLKPDCDDNEVLVSRMKVGDFKRWLDK